MNVFCFDRSPYLSALWLDDVRKNKMILESSQLLSTAINFNDPLTDWRVYKPAYISHPCSIWTRTSRGNFIWLLDYLEQLIIQKENGYSHKCASLVPVFQKYSRVGRFKQEDQTPFVNCARNLQRNVDFKYIEDVHLAYKLYISNRWSRDSIELSWKWGKKPDWFNTKEARV